MQCLEKLLNQVQTNYNSQFRNTENRILVVSPELTGTNFYRFVLPAMIINSTDNYTVAFTNIRPWKSNPKERFYPQKIELSSREIIWPHTMIFPFTFDPMKEIFQELRSINPLLHITYSLDFNFLRTPPTHPYYPVITDESLRDIIENIAYSDKTMMSNPFMVQSLIRDFQANGININSEKLKCTPLFTDRMILDDIPELKKEKKNFFHVLILCNENQFESYKACMPLIRSLKEKYKHGIKLSIFSMNKERAEFISLMKGIEYVPMQPVHISKYYSKIASVNPDVVFIPNMLDEFSQSSDDYKRFLDCSMLGIPIITQRLYPLMECIGSSQNGYVYGSEEDFHRIMDDIIANPGKASEVGLSLFFIFYFRVYVQ